MISLALKKILHNKFISAAVVSSFALGFIIFILLNTTLDKYAQELTKRTEGNILVVGKSGALIDLIMDSLYFKQGNHNFVKNEYILPLQDEVPTARMFNLYSCRNFPLIGTDIDYFDIRKLTFRDGISFTKLGECVIGSKVAEKLDLKVGDQLVTDPTNIFDPGGSTPIQLTVVGVVNHTDSPDDSAVFCSLKTAWTAHGLGHSHSEKTEGPDLSQKMLTFTDENLKTFHFHGDEKDYPLTSALILPEDNKAKNILTAEANAKGEVHVIEPKAGLAGFLTMIFQINTLFSFIMLMVILVFLLGFILIFYLQFKMRRKEKELFTRIGASKDFFSRLVYAEWIILGGLGVGIGYIVSLLLNPILLQIFDKITKG
ncbi:MAG: ABC transporter permease [Lentisphaeraceae bacterium]|nr:ABC transporter permease [Lentisphaeraceae bacterium]